MKFIKYIIVLLLVIGNLQAREKINVNFSNMKISDLIKLVSKINHKNILMNQKVGGEINFISTAPIYDDELMNILLSVLDNRGYTLVKDGSIYKVVRLNDAVRSNLSIVKSNQKLNNSLMVTKIIKVKNENVDTVASKIRYLISRAAKLITIKNSNSILITDYPQNIKTIEKAIKEISVHDKKVVSIIPIKNTNAKKLQNKLENISKSIFNQGIEEQKVKIIYDENVNGLVLIGLVKNVESLKKLIKKMDVTSYVNQNIRIFKLKNSDVDSVLKTLNNIISKQTFSDPSAKPSVSANKELNAIVAVGEPIMLEGLKKIISDLDTEKYQVYVQAKIIEINKNRAKDIGVKYGFAAGDVSSSGLYAMSANFGSNDLTTSASGAVLTALGDIGSTAKTALALGATLNFLKSHGAAKSISNPSVLCMNNKPSSIYVGKTISIASGQTAVSGSTTVSYKRKDIGLTLKVKPRVSSKDKVTLDVVTSLENVLDDGKNNATHQPITSKQEVKTEAILRNGENIIIGGLVKNYIQKSHSKVPILGDIPLLGHLFSSNDESFEQDDLVVILTPYVIDKSTELSKLQQKLGLLAKIQEEYNKKAEQLVEKKIFLKKDKIEQIKQNKKILKATPYKENSIW
jgi:general secretion pathway protein D